MRAAHSGAPGGARDLGGCLYLVGGKLFHVEPGALDPSVPADAARLAEYAELVRVEGTPAHAVFGGADTICHVRRAEDGGRVCAEAWDPSDLPEGVRGLAEKAMAELGRTHGRDGGRRSPYA